MTSHTQRDANTIHALNTWVKRGVQRVNSSTHWMNHHPLDNSMCLVVLAQWIVIYLLDSIIQALNNYWGLVFQTSISQEWEVNNPSP